MPMKGFPLDSGRNDRKAAFPAKFEYSKEAQDENEKSVVVPHRHFDFYL